MSMFGVISEKDWIGLSLEEANQKAESLGLLIRVIEKNGTPFMVTADVKSNRVNVRINNNKIIGAHTG